MQQELPPVITVCLWERRKTWRLETSRATRCFFSLQNTELLVLRCSELKANACVTPIPLTRLQNPCSNFQGTVSRYLRPCCRMLYIDKTWALDWQSCWACCVALIPAFGKWSRKVNLGYIVSSRPAWATCDPVQGKELGS